MIKLKFSSPELRMVEAIKDAEGISLPKAIRVLVRRGYYTTIGVPVPNESTDPAQLDMFDTK